MLISTIVLTLLVDGYIYFLIRRSSFTNTAAIRLGRHDFNRRRSSRRGSTIYLISCFLCWALLIVAVSLPRRDGDSSLLPVMWMLYTYFTIYIAKIVFIIFSLLGFLPRLWGGRRLHTGTIIGLPAATAVFLIMWWGAIWGSSELQTNYVDVKSERVPASFNGYRIVQFSDAHVGTWGNDTTFVSHLVDSINALQPDMIVFTGDIVNRNTAEILPFVKTLSRLKAADGVYSVLGNHDYGDYQTWNSLAEREKNNRQLADIQKKMGWQLLNNEHRYIVRGTDSIAVIGVENWGDPPFSQYGDLDKAFPASPKAVHHQNDSLFKVLLTHNPEHWRQVVSKKSNIDLTLSGHTHAMQMMLTIGGWRWSPAEYRYTNWAGMYETDNPQKKPVRLYVNIGAGEVGMPARIGATPEITVFTLSRPHK